MDFENYEFEKQSEKDNPEEGKLNKGNSALTKSEKE